MFDKLKQLSQLKKIQDKAKQEKAEVSENGVKVVINGNFEVEEIALNKELNSEDQAIVLKNCFNKAVKEIQTKL